MYKHSEQGLSTRGSLAANSPMRVDMQVYFEALENRYHEQDNPDGKFPMNVAENTLCWSMLKEKLQAVAKQEIPEWVGGYGNPAGNDGFRAAAANYLSEFLFHCEVPKETLAFSSGLTSVIDLTSFLLANPGEVAMIPAPAYPVYTSDIGVKAGVERYDITTHHSLAELKNGIPLTINQLEESLAEIKAKGKTAKMLILTTPDNPTGGIYKLEQLKEIANWCIVHQIHLVVNEIYGLTTINTDHPNLKELYDDSLSFTSFATIMQTYKSPYLHLWYSISKDLGLSGFRVGMVHSYNEEFLAGYTNINMTHSVSNYTQWTLQQVFEDMGFMKKYLNQMQKALTESYVIVHEALQSIGIAHSPAYGSLFAWMDLGELLAAQTREAEEVIWLEIYEKAGLLLTPTNGFGHEQFGLYRMVISYVSPKELKVAMERLTSFIKNKRKRIV